MVDSEYRSLDGDLLLTTACPVECGFCVYSCNKSITPEKWMQDELIRRVAEQYSKNDIGVRICGGEPFYDMKRLEGCIDILLEYYKPSELLVITSGFWANSEENTARVVRTLDEKQIDRIVVSFDRFHQKRVPTHNIKRIVKTAKEAGIEAVVRISLDSESFAISEEAAELITRYDARCEVHDWGPFGRGAGLDNTCTKNFDKIRNYFFGKIREYGSRYNAPEDPEYYQVHSAKRKRANYSNTFFPTTFPNGDVYGCSITTNGSYMGNLKNEGLSALTEKWKRTLPGSIVLSKKSNCDILCELLPDGNGRCNLCKNQPFLRNPPENSIGRGFLEINPEKPQYPLQTNRELLVSLQIKRIALTKGTSEKIGKLLSELRRRQIPFELSKPVPSCISPKQIKFKAPKSCYECAELFTIKEGKIRVCNSKEDIPVENALSRRILYAKFVSNKNALPLPQECLVCVQRLRRKCEGNCCKAEDSDGRPTKDPF